MARYRWCVFRDHECHQVDSLLSKRAMVSAVGRDQCRAVTNGLLGRLAGQTDSRSLERDSVHASVSFSVIRCWGQFDLEGRLKLAEGIQLSNV